MASLAAFVCSLSAYVRFLIAGCVLCIEELGPVYVASRFGFHRAVSLAV